MEFLNRMTTPLLWCDWLRRVGAFV